jgi:hypothetical protein
VRRYSSMDERRLLKEYMDENFNITIFKHVTPWTMAAAMSELIRLGFVDSCAAIFSEDNARPRLKIGDMYSLNRDKLAELLLKYG